MPVKTQKKTNLKERIQNRFTFLYNEETAQKCIDRLGNLLSDYNFDFNEGAGQRSGWNETHAILITYGDVIISDDDTPRLQLLKKFLDENLQEFISTVHILPFFPSSSDAGFAVMDYKKVREDLGTWEDIEQITQEFDLMVDLVINHASRFSHWFENYQKGKSPGKDYFIEADPSRDFSTVTRPRNSPLLTTVQTDRGLRHVWTTFSDDQVDLDFTNPDVLFEFIDIFLFYYSKGARVIRLDAIAYLWKQIGTSSIHLPETHQVVKLFRDLTECIDPEISLLTETNVPFNENINYFGDEDEAHMIYQFSLPPLLLHAILTENASYLTKWAAELPELPDDCTYFNFTASHDGIGVRPLEGLVPPEEFDYLIKSTEERGGFVSYKKNADSGQSPYELNITYFDAFEQPGNPRSSLQMKRYMCSQIIMLSLKGVPGIYFHNMTATKNNLDGVLETGKKRDINRKQWKWDELQRNLEKEDTAAHYALQKYKKLLEKRQAHPAFHPAAKQDVFDMDDNIFAFIRTAREGEEQILVISNVSRKKMKLQAEAFEGYHISPQGVTDLISEETVFPDGSIKLKAFQTVWLKL